MTLPRMIRELMLPSAYSHPVDQVDLIETHISWVLIAGDCVYKVKKPLDLGFLDFTTIERRQQACDDELRLNRRLTRDIYLGVVPVVEREGAARVGGEGSLLDYAVRMRRLPEPGMLSKALPAGEVTPGHLRQLARDLAAFHESAASGAGVDEYASASAIAANWGQNFEAMEPHASLAPTWVIQGIRSGVDRWLREYDTVFRKRQLDGRIREGHGDLHTGNLCLVEDRLVPFDCLEFAARYRCADVAAEIAFLAMDLEQWGRPDLAWHFVTQYVRLTRDRQILQLLPFYKCYRAFVRGKILALRLSQTAADAPERASLAQRARACFDLALCYATQVRSHLITMVGLPASGKSQLAADLSQRQGALVISTDVVRKRLAGYQPSDRAGALYGTGIYSRATTDRVYAQLRQQAARWLLRGVSVILDGSFGDRHQRALAHAVADRTGAAFHLVWVACSDEERQRRIAQRAQDPLRVSDATWEIAEQMRANFTEPTEFDPSELVVDQSGGKGADAVLERWQRPLVEMSTAA
jgi:uncharacterized protein